MSDKAINLVVQIIFIGLICFLAYHILDKQHSEKNVQTYFKEKDVEQLSNFMRHGSIWEKGEAEKLLTELSKRGNEDALIALFDANKQTIVLRILVSGYIPEKLKQRAFDLVLLDLNRHTNKEGRTRRYAKNAIIELGKLKDPRSVNALLSSVDIENNNSWKDIALISAHSLEMLQQEEKGSPEITTWLRDSVINDISRILSRTQLRTNLVSLLNDTDIFIRSGAVYLLMKLDDANTDSTYWPYMYSAVQHQIFEKRGLLAKNNWRITKLVLLTDVRSNDYNKILNSVAAFIGIGKQAILKELKMILTTEGNKNMAEAYLNSGSRELREAAEKWADNNGFIIKTGEGYHPVNWGEWGRK